MRQHQNIEHEASIDRLEQIFSRVVAIAPQQRGAFLDEACGSDVRLRSKIERLLQADDTDTQVVRTAPWPDGAAGTRWTPDETEDPLGQPGTQIDQYRILESIGAGGFGRVFRAEQEAPVRRQVAIKLLKRGMDTESVLKRFQQERQILASLEHPHIARFYGGGTTTDGRPYLVMEHVAGVPIDRYCEDRQLTVEAQLELIRQVCDAVQYAHSNLVLHRDLKPHNILIEENGTPKLLDFGIARVLDPDDADGAGLTSSAAQIMTPRYASPEQVRGERLTTASDVYSLGIVLYRLLTGCWPYGSDTSGRRELEDLICDYSPPRPSLAVSNGDPTLRLRSKLQGDLDWIILKCLEKDTSRRYASAGALADDISRYLTNRPVLAGPPTLRYRTRKFVQRNWRSIAAATAMAAVLIIATVVSLRAALREKIARTDAVTAQVQAEENAALAEIRAAEAVAQAEIAAAVSGFFNDDLLAVIAPSSAPDAGRDVLLREVLDAASSRIETAAQPNGRFWQRPLVEAEIRETIADAYTSLAEYDATVRHLERALEIRIIEQGKQHPKTLVTMSRLGAYHLRVGDYETAETLLLEAHETAGQSLGVAAPETLAIQSDVARWHVAQGRYDEALAMLESSYDGLCAARGPTAPQTMRVASDLGSLLQTMGRYEDAAHHVHQTYESIRTRFGDDNRAAYAALQQRGNLAVKLGDYENALRDFEAALAGRFDICGPNHTDTLTTEFALGDLLKKMGRLEDAHEHYAAALAGRRVTLGPDNPATRETMRGVASILHLLDRHDEAEELIRESLALEERLMGAEHPATLESHALLGSLYFSMNRLEDAEKHSRIAWVGRKALLGADHPATLTTLNNLAATLRRLRRFDEAEPLIREGLKHRRRVLGETHPATLQSLNSLGVMLLKMKRYDDAEPFILETWERRRDVLGEDHPATINARMNVAGLFDFTGRLDESLAHHKAVLAAREKVLPPDHADTLRSTSVVGIVLRKLERLDEAVEFAAAAYEGAKRSLPAGHFGIGAYGANYGRLLLDLDRYADAAKVLENAYEIFEATVGPKHPRTRGTVRLLGSLYDRWHAAEPDAAREEAAKRWADLGTSASNE